MNTLCRVCLELKYRVKAEKTKGNRGHYYRDGAGKRWHGFMCPSCHLLSVKKRYFEEPVERLSEEKSTRLCRVCKKSLPVSRYFKHLHCDFAHYAYASNGQTPTVWTGEEYGGSFGW